MLSEAVLLFELYDETRAARTDVDARRLALRKAAKEINTIRSAKSLDLPPSTFDRKVSFVRERIPNSVKGSEGQHRDALVTKK